MSAARRHADDMFSASDAYEQFMGRWSRLLAGPFIAFAGVQSGDAVLDVGSGTGALCGAVLAATTSGRIVGVDASSAYVDHARATTPSERVRFETGDGQQLRFPAGGFDKALSMLVLNFIPDPSRAVSEMMRVSRPGGGVAAAVWDYGEGMEMLRAFWDEAVVLDPASESRDERHMPLCRPGELAALWRQRGLTGVVEAPLVIGMPFTSFDDFWSPFQRGQGPAGAYLASLPAPRQELLRERLRTRVAGGSGAFRLTARAWAVRGAVPS